MDSYEGSESSRNTENLSQRGRFYDGKTEWKPMNDACIYFTSAGKSFVAPCSHQEYYNNGPRVTLRGVRGNGEYLDNNGGVWS